MKFFSILILLIFVNIHVFSSDPFDLDRGNKAPDSPTSSSATIIIDSGSPGNLQAPVAFVVPGAPARRPARAARVPRQTTIQALRF